MRIAICDDDSNFAEKLKRLIERSPDMPNVQADISIYNDGFSFIENVSGCDAVFLDIDMPVVNGFDIAEQVNHMGNTIIIFVTMHDELVYSSIKFQPFRFIRKSRLENELPEVLGALNKTLIKRRLGKRFQFQTKKGVVFLDVSNIEYIEIYGHWLHVCVDGGEDLECYGSLSDFEKQLAPFDFVRTHKSYLVNCKYIYSIEKDQIILDDKTIILLSRYRVNDVKDKFKKYIRNEL